MKKYLLIIPVLFLLANPTYAANTTGSAWSESVGWFNFSNTTVNDNGLFGYAYNDNTGWLALEGVVNTEGTLSGYAWSESVGYFNFDNVSITDGAFSGYAYNDNTGWLSFEDGTSVTTDWRIPTTSRIISSGSSRASRERFLNNNQPNEEQASPQTPSSSPSNAPRDIQLGDRGNDVRVIQILLNYLGYTVSNEGAGSPGNETDLYGQLTREAVIRFQQENNIQPAVGYFGPLTRTALIQKLLQTLLTEA